MNKSGRVLAAIGLVCMALSAVVAGAGVWGVKRAENRVFELRAYTPHPGKMTGLQSRFRDHTVELFKKHGITNIGYWVTMDNKEGEPKLIYLLAHKSKEAASAGFREFGADPEWQKARSESEKDGPLVAKVESVFLSPTDFSPIK